MLFLDSLAPMKDMLSNVIFFPRIVLNTTHEMKFTISYVNRTHNFENYVFLIFGLNFLIFSPKCMLAVILSRFFFFFFFWERETIC